MGDLILDEAPLYSKMRIVYDLTEGSTFPVFNHANSYVGANNGVLKVFTWGIGDNPSAGGYHQTTTVNESLTNMQRKGEVPGGGAMDVGALAFLPDQFVLKPATATLQGATQIANGSHYHVKDIFQGQAYSQMLRMLAKSFVPFIQYGDSGAKNYLGSLQLFPAGRGIFDGRVAKQDGPVFRFSEPLRWRPRGKYANLVVGLELKEESWNAPWAADGGAGATDPGQTLRTLLGYPAAAAAPGAAGVVLACLDLKVILLGKRFAAAGDD